MGEQTVTEQLHHYTRTPMTVLGLKFNGSNDEQMEQFVGGHVVSRDPSPAIESSNWMPANVSADGKAQVWSWVGAWCPVETGDVIVRTQIGLAVLIPSVLSAGWDDEGPVG
jgi:hypothetical protein